MNPYEQASLEIKEQVERWENKLMELPDKVVNEKFNGQNRNIKMILGHMIDSASNNNHRLVHLQYGENPLQFPDYARKGNNDKWIAIQNYKAENWPNIVQLWKYINLHFAHIILQINTEKENNIWMTGLNMPVALKDMVIDYNRHLFLHLEEIQALIDKP